MHSIVEPFTDDGQPTVFQSRAAGLIYIRTTPETSCPNSSSRPLLKAISDRTREVIFFHPSCGSWSCPVCSVRNTNYWRYVAAYGVTQLQETGKPVNFVTVTSHERLKAAGTLYVLKQAFPKLRDRVAYHSPGTQYLLIPEQHKDGRWHLHMFTTCMAPKRWWKDNARACGFGYQCDVEQVTNAGKASNYVAKYMAKSLAGATVPKGFRRVRTSQQWPYPASEGQSANWTITKLPAHLKLSDQVDMYTTAGYTTIFAGSEIAWRFMGPSEGRPLY